MNEPRRSICVMGLGYIGLPTASLLGTKGYKVHGVDVSQNVIDTINSGGIHIVEPDLDIMVKSAVGAGNLKASMTPIEADIFVIAVPTPLRAQKTEGSELAPTPDTSFVEEATKAISPYVKKGNLVILESTSPLGTTEDVVARILSENGHDLENDVYVAHCPERVLPGRILIELVENDRIVGGVTPEATAEAASFYEEFVRGEVLRTTAKTAELVKLSENSFRDVNIAFANELSIICDAEGIHPWEAIELANRHPRVDILQPGPGVGGHCIAVDPWFIVSRAPKLARLIRSAREVNEAKPDWVLEKIRKSAEKFRNPTVACLGLAFKADVDDLRESPALMIAQRIKDEITQNLIVCEPNISELDGFHLTTASRAIAEADIIVVLVDHKSFKTINRNELDEKIVIDTKGLFRQKNHI